VDHPPLLRLGGTGFVSLPTAAYRAIWHR
jgi:hypothetical protein